MRPIMPQRFSQGNDPGSVLCTDSAGHITPVAHKPSWGLNTSIWCATTPVEGVNGGEGPLHNMKSHQEVIRDFVHRHGSKATGHSVVSNPLGLYSRRGFAAGPTEPLRPLAIRPSSGGIVVNGEQFDWQTRKYQEALLREAAAGPESFAVVPFDSLTAALTDGKVSDWSRAPFTVEQLRKDVQVVVPSAGETWREVETKDKHGRKETRNVHTLGDSVVRVQQHLYLSGVDETGRGRGTYFFAQLRRPGTPRSVAEAYDVLKPDPVREAEARGQTVRRQGEWFAIPTSFTTSQLQADVAKGWATHAARRVLGRDGHHQVDEVIHYERGPRKGEVYGRGILQHTENDHYDLDLGFRWHRLVHNVQGNSYSMQGNFD
jgi:hypothetical protein